MYKHIDIQMYKITIKKRYSVGPRTNKSKQTIVRVPDSFLISLYCEMALCASLAQTGSDVDCM